MMRVGERENWREMQPYRRWTTVSAVVLFVPRVTFHWSETGVIDLNRGQIPYGSFFSPLFQLWNTR